MPDSVAIVVTSVGNILMIYNVVDIHGFWINEWMGNNGHLKIGDSIVSIYLYRWFDLLFLSFFKTVKIKSDLNFFCGWSINESGASTWA